MLLYPSPPLTPIRREFPFQTQQPQMAEAQAASSFLPSLVPWIQPKRPRRKGVKSHLGVFSSEIRKARQAFTHGPRESLQPAVSS